MMKKFHYLIVATLTISFIGMGCAHERVEGKLNLSVEEVKIDSWLNLMPGGSHTFHITGEIKLENKESYEIKNLRLSTITVIQLDKRMYSFAPEFTPKIENENRVIPSETEKVFIFYTQSGLPINKELDIGLPIKLIMLFREDDDSFLYEIENIKVEKVY